MSHRHDDDDYRPEHVIVYAVLAVLALAAMIFLYTWIF